MGASFRYTNHPATPRELFDRLKNFEIRLGDRDPASPAVLRETAFTIKKSCDVFPCHSQLHVMPMGIHAERFKLGCILFNYFTITCGVVATPAVRYPLVFGQAVGTLEVYRIRMRTSRRRIVP